jgi:hypothetical protein
VDAAKVAHEAVLPDGTVVPIAPAARTLPLAEAAPADLPEPYRAAGPTRRVPLGLIAGARSGDKGGTANVGVWVRSDPAWAWLAHTLTVDELRRLLPEAAPLPITRYVLPNLRALDFVIDGLLGDGVSAGTRFDPQGKGIGEWLRSRFIEIPQELL